VFLKGDELGIVPPDKLTLIKDDPSAVKKVAQRTLKEILENHFGYTGAETIKPIASQVIGVDKSGNVHVRFKQHVDSLPLEGASLSLHFSGRTGEVFGMNGEVHNFISILNNTSEAASFLDCDAAMEVALAEYKSELEASMRSDPAGMWLSECQLAAVQGRDGKPYLAYKKLFGYQPPPQPITGTNTTNVTGTEPYQMDLVFSERATGRLVAIHPKVFGARTMITYDCRFREVDYPSECTIAQTSPLQDCNERPGGEPRAQQPGGCLRLLRRSAWKEEHGWK
jgi:Zn-dependent metalloprotease